MVTEKLIELLGRRHKDGHPNRLYERAAAARLRYLSNSMLKHSSLSEYTQPYRNIPVRSYEMNETHVFFKTTLIFPNIFVYKNMHQVPTLYIHKLESVPVSYCFPNQLDTVGTGVNARTVYFTVRNNQIYLKIPLKLKQGALAISEINFDAVLENPREWLDPNTGEFFDFRTAHFPMPDEAINRLLYDEQYTEEQPAVEE